MHTIPLDKRMSTFIVDEDGCWLWQKRLTKGYGQIKIEREWYMVHRVSYELLVGPIPDGLVLDHECHNQDLTCHEGPDCKHRRCINPAHLVPVTSQANVASSNRKLRGTNKQRK